MNELKIGDYVCFKIGRRMVFGVVNKFKEFDLYSISVDADTSRRYLIGSEVAFSYVYFAGISSQEEAAQTMALLSVGGQ